MIESLFCANSSKVCSRCSRSKKNNEFYSKGIGRIDSICKECSRSKKKELFKRSKKHDQFVSKSASEWTLLDFPEIRVDLELLRHAQEVLTNLSTKDKAEIERKLLAARIKGIREIWRVLNEDKN